MTLLDQIAADRAAILADTEGGFARAVTVINPAGTSKALKGLWADIGQSIDPETGVLVAGRVASVALDPTALSTAGLAIPVGIADSSSKPWRVTVTDALGAVQQYKVSEAMPDRALGIVTCMLEQYKP